jgi:sterol desaturase/sphingolipid hydroxylase (fatty acid hydroxylase superfamily)
MNLLQTLQTHLPGLAVDVLRLSLWLVLLAVLFVPLERYFGERQRPRTELLSDLGFYFISSLLPAALLAVPLALVAVAGQRFLPDAVPATLGALPLWAKLLLGLFIGEVGTYWGHRLSHESPWLWRYHAVHHSTEQLYFLANTRTHPVDMVVTRLFGLTPLYLLGLAGPGAAGSAAPVLLLLIGTVWGFFIHANLRWRFGPLEWLVATPAFPLAPQQVRAHQPQLRVHPARAGPPVRHASPAGRVAGQLRHRGPHARQPGRPAAGTLAPHACPGRAQQHGGGPAD